MCLVLVTARQGVGSVEYLLVPCTYVGVKEWENTILSVPCTYVGVNEWDSSVSSLCPWRAKDWGSR